MLTFLLIVSIEKIRLLFLIFLLEQDDENKVDSIYSTLKNLVKSFFAYCLHNKTIQITLKNKKKNSQSRKIYNFRTEWFNMGLDGKSYSS